MAKNSCGTTDLPNALTILIIAMGAAFLAGLGWIFKMHLELARVLMEKSSFEIGTSHPGTKITHKCLYAICSEKVFTVQQCPTVTSA